MSGAAMARPPRLLRSLVARFAPADLVADLDERYARRRRRDGRRSAGRWYVRQALSCLVHARALRPGPRRPPRRSLRRGLDALGHDAVDAARSLVRAPLFAVGTVVVLGLGLGASTLVFTVTDWLLLRPLPGVREPGRLISVRMSPREGDGVFPVSNPMAEGLDERVEALSGMAAYTEAELHLSVRGFVEPRALSGQMVTGNFFDVLGMRMDRGRGFTSDEGSDPGAARVAVISERLWRQAFGKRPDVVGLDTQINGHAFEIIGVAAAGFLGPERPGDADVWVPVAAYRIVMPTYPEGLLDSAQMTPFFDLVGRLRPGVTMEAATAQIIAAHAALEHSLSGQPRAGELRPVVEAGVGLMPGLRESLERTLAALLAVVAFLTLVTCANFANLLLARGLERRREIAVRSALGASRARLVRQRVLMACYLAMTGAAVGLMAESQGAGMLRGTRIVGFTAPLGEMDIDLRVVGFALIAALLTGAVFGALPALALTRRRPAEQLHGVRGASGGGRLRGGLMALQLGVSFALLVAALTATGTLADLRNVDLGFRPQGVVTFGVQPGLQGLARDEQVALYDGLVSGLRALPEAEHVALSWLAPHGRGRADTAVALPGQDVLEQGVDATYNLVSDDFFAALGLPVIGGRGFEREDLYVPGEAGGVVVVSESLARRLFPDEPAVGREVSLAWHEDALYRIVGVVADARMVSVTEDAGPAVYEPMGQPWLNGSAWVHVRSSLSTAQIVAAARRVLDEVGPELPVSDPDTLRAHMERRLSQPVLVARLSGGFALLAALLAGTGLFGVLSALVAESRRELGVRAALGATASALRRLVLGRGVRTAAGGLAIGVVPAWILSRGMAAALPSARSLDPSYWVGAAVLLGAVVLAASLRPAIGAGRLQPMDVLRRD